MNPRIKTQHTDKYVMLSCFVRPRVTGGDWVIENAGPIPVKPELLTSAATSASTPESLEAPPGSWTMSDVESENSYRY
jgi:hypothetical protein